MAARLRRRYLSMKREIVEWERDKAERGDDPNRFRRRLEKMTVPGAVFNGPPHPSIGGGGSLGHAIIAITEGKPEGPDLLYRSFYYQMVDLYCAAAGYIAGKPSMTIFYDFNKVALLLAEAVTLGCWTEAERIANILRYGLAERRPFYGEFVCAFRKVDWTSVAPFVLHLYAQWSGKPFPLDDLPIRPMFAYEPLLALWQTEDLEALEEALLAACDFHLELSKAPESSTTEFNTSDHDLYPVEIMALLRLRETKGLTNPIIDHPLLQSPIARLHAIRPLPHDERMDQAVANYLSTLPASVTGQLFS